MLLEVDQRRQLSHLSPSRFPFVLFHVSGLSSQNDRHTHRRMLRRPSAKCYHTEETAHGVKNATKIPLARISTHLHTLKRTRVYLNTLHTSIDRLMSTEPWNPNGTRIEPWDC